MRTFTVRNARWLVGLVAFAAVPGFAWAGAATPIGVYSTGQIPGGGGLVPPGAPDGNYSLTLAPIPVVTGVPAVAVSPLPAAWAPNRTTSQWINPDGLGSTPATYHPGGAYIFSTSFSLAGFDPTSTVISLEWIADDNLLVPGFVSLNGFDISDSSPPSDGWTDSDWTAVTVSTATVPPGFFLPGLNELTFTITNTQTLPSPTGPTGIQVDILSATATPIPEPTTLALLGCAVVLVSHRRTR